MSTTLDRADGADVGFSVGADAKATRRMARVGQGRTLAIDFYVARCCTSSLVGDLELRWLEGDLPAGFQQVGFVAGSRIVADHRLVETLRRSAARIVESRGLFGPSLSVRLEAGEHWLAFLETPAARRIRGRMPPPRGDSTQPMI